MIEQWEPRITILDVPIVGVESESTYYITIAYTIPELHKTGEYKLTLSNR
jgi:hypothetical protein